MNYERKRETTCLALVSGDQGPCRAVMASWLFAWLRRRRPRNEKGKRGRF